MVPLAWRCLIRQAERPDQVAFTILLCWCTTQYFSLCGDRPELPKESF